MVPRYNISQLIPTGNGPTALFFDYKNKILYVTNGKDNSLSVIKKDVDNDKNFSQNPDRVSSEYFSNPVDVAVDSNNNLVFVD